MVIARIKGLKISLADERHNPTGEEMIPFLDGSKNGRIRMADFKGMALHVLNVESFTESDCEDLLSAIQASRVIFIPNKDKTGLKVVTEVSTNGNTIHLESPDYELNSKGDKIAKVWFDTIDITTNPLNITRGIKETIELKSDGVNTRVLTEDGLYTDIDDIALVKLIFKADKASEAVYDLNSTSITFREADTPSVHWNVEKDGNELYMNLEIDLATTTSNGLMSKDDKVKLDEELPAEIERLDKRCNRLRRRINKTDAKLDLEIKERTEQWDTLKTHWETEQELREHADKELKKLITDEAIVRRYEDNLIRADLLSKANSLDKKFSSATQDLDTALREEIAKRAEDDNTTKKQLNDFMGLKGKNGGLATLDSDGKIPSTNLPSYVDDVLEFPHKDKQEGDAEDSTTAFFPKLGETGKIYVDLSDGKTYRWSGHDYVEISASLALGETNSTAFPGNRGKDLETKFDSTPQTIVTKLTGVTQTDSLAKINYKSVTKGSTGYGEESSSSVDIQVVTADHAGLMTPDLKLQLDGLDARITDESNRALEAEEKLKHDIEKAVSESNAADAGIRQLIEQERTARENAVKTEKDRAEKAEADLQSKIDAENDRATAQELSLQEAITLELIDRAAMDKQHDTKINENKAAIDEEKKRSQALDTAHDNAISGLTKDLSAEKERAKGVEADLGAKITAEEKARSDKDNEHDAKLKSLQDTLTSVQANPVTVNQTGTGNTVINVTGTGKTITVLKGNRVDKAGDSMTGPLHVLYGSENSGITIKRTNDNGEVSQSFITTDTTSNTGIKWVIGNWNNTENGATRKSFRFWYGTDLLENKNTTGEVKASITEDGYVVANSGFKKNGGTAALFLKADGSVTTLTATALAGSAANVTFDNATGKFVFTLPKGDKGDNGLPGAPGEPGTPGENGKTWRPNVATNGQLTWTQSDDTTAPSPVNIKGADGKNGTNGTNGTNGAPGKDGKVWRPSLSGTSIKWTLGEAGDTSAISADLADKFVTLDTPLTISGSKTFDSALLFNISTANGLTFYNSEWSTILGGIGMVGNTAYIGWGTTPTSIPNCLRVGDSLFTYKANDVLYNNFASTITFTGEGSVTAPHFYKSSDARLKTNIQPLTHTLDLICSIPTISFDLNNDHRIGTTALALEELGFNELVTESEILKSEVANPNAFESFTKDDKEYVMVKKVEYDNLSVLAIEGIKLLREEVKQLKAELEELKYDR